MLVLSRKINEQIKITDDITITIVEIYQHKVKIGIEAPDSVVVHRQEVWEAIKQAREATNGHA
jgi:carbon storage regulator